MCPMEPIGRLRPLPTKAELVRRMAEPSPDKIIIGAIGPLITSVIGAAIAIAVVL
jgi:hypothetical protein